MKIKQYKSETIHISRINVNISLYVHHSYIFTKNLKKKPDFNSAQPGPEKKKFSRWKKNFENFSKRGDHQKILPIFIEKIRVINIYQDYVNISLYIGTFTLIFFLKWKIKNKSENKKYDQKNKIIRISRINVNILKDFKN